MISQKLETGTHLVHIQKKNWMGILVFAETADGRQMASFTSMKRSRRCYESGSLCEELTTKFKPTVA